MAITLRFREPVGASPGLRFAAMFRVSCSENPKLASSPQSKPCHPALTESPMQGFRQMRHGIETVERQSISGKNKLGQ